MSGRNFHGIAFRFFFAVSLSGALIIGAIYATINFYATSLVEQSTERYANSLVASAVQHIDGLLSVIENRQELLVDEIQTRPELTQSDIEQLLHELVSTSKGVYGATAAFEPGQYPWQAGEYAPYYFIKNGQTEKSDLATPEYQYRKHSWYQDPISSGGPVWSEPYFDDGGGDVVMTTYSIPLYREVDGQPKVMGVLTADVSLDWLGKVVSGLELHGKGYAALFSPETTYMAHPDKTLLVKETIFSVAEKIGDPVIRRIGERIANGESGFVPTENIKGKQSWIYFAPVPSTGWSLAVVFSAEKMLADVRSAGWIFLFICIAGFFVLVVAVILVARTVTRPLTLMTDAVQKIALGDLNVSIDVATNGGEVGLLAGSFVKMQEDLKSYIEELTATVSAKERIENELNIAHDIQMSILPKIFPAFPEKDEFDVFAVIQPAKEVGGDFYDFFEVDATHLAFVIGDVSGKGVPASLFMAVTKTLIKAIALSGLAPDEVLMRVNSELSVDNDACMFVTIFLAILNIETGEVVFANGGHNPPLLLGKDGAHSWLPVSGCLVVGAMEDIPYHNDSLVLNHGDRLFLYTDGVTEAMNVQGEQYSEDKLEKTLELSGKDGIRDVVGEVMNSIEVFADGEPQSDDITILVLEYR